MRRDAHPEADPVRHPFRTALAGALLAGIATRVVVKTSVALVVVTLLVAA